MAIYIKTEKAKALLEEIIIKITKTEEIDTWDYEDEKFIHNPDQWRNKAYFTSYPITGRLVFGLTITPHNDKNKNPDDTYKMYQERFIDMIKRHFTYYSERITEKKDKLYDSL